MKRLGRLALALALAGTWACALAQEVGVMHWQVLDMPPAFTYPDGHQPRTPDELGNGEVDGFMRLLIAQMPQYRHEFVEAGIARFEALSRSGKAMCSLLLVRTPERLDWLFYTPVYTPQVSRQLHVVVRRDRLAAFSSPNGQLLQLADIIKRQDLTGLLQKDRSYGPRIDALIRSQAPAGPKYMVTGRTNQLLSMLRAGRMDYTLDYPQMVDEFLRKEGPGPELVELPIVEGLSTQMVHAACSRNPEGRRAIEAIDLAERQLAQDPRRDALLREWRGDKADETDRLRLKHFMDERARAGARIE